MQIQRTITKDIQKKNTINIPNTKNIKIDLNGKTLSSTNTDVGFSNSGKLEIVDTSIETIEKAGIMVYNDEPIDTGIKLTGNYRIQTSVKLDSNSVNNCLWGTGNSKYYSSIGTNLKLTYASNNSGSTSTNVMEVGKIYTIEEEHKNGTITGYVDGDAWVTKAVTNSSVDSDNIKLFYANSTTGTGRMTVYGFKIYKEENLVLDLIPVKENEEIDGKVAQKNG